MDGIRGGILPGLDVWRNGNQGVPSLRNIKQLYNHAEWLFQFDLYYGLIGKS